MYQNPGNTHKFHGRGFRQILWFCRPGSSELQTTPIDVAVPASQIFDTEEEFRQFSSGAGLQDTPEIEPETDFVDAEQETEKLVVFSNSVLAAAAPPSDYEDKTEAADYADYGEHLGSDSVEPGELVIDMSGILQ